MIAFYWLKVAETPLVMSNEASRFYRGSYLLGVSADFGDSLRDRTTEARADQTEDRVKERAIKSRRSSHTHSNRMRGG
jgi:hypothetical protein